MNPKNNIPADRPVIGQDLDVIRQVFGILTADMSWATGQSITRWTKVVRQLGQEPLSDPTLALQLRLFDVAPYLNPIPEYPSAAETYAYICELRPGTTAKEFALMLGAEGTAGYRWQRGGQRVGANARRLMYYLMKFLKASERPAQQLDNWIKLVGMEAKVRGVPDLFEAGRWGTDETEGAKKKKALAELKKAQVLQGGDAKTPAKKVPAKRVPATKAKSAKKPKTA